MNHGSCWENAWDAPVSSDISASADKAGTEMPFWCPLFFFVVEEFNRKEREGHFQRKEWEVCFGGSQPMSAGGGAEEPTIRPDHQIFNDTDQQSPQRGVEVDFSRPPQQTELVLDSPLTLIVFAPWHTLTASDGLVPLGLHDWLLHVWDHQVSGGEELVCGHHQPDRAAAHHHLLCWVSRFCVCMVLGGFFMWFWFLLFVEMKSSGSESDSLSLIFHTKREVKMESAALAATPQVFVKIFKYWMWTY